MIICLIMSNLTFAVCCLLAVLSLSVAQQLDDDEDTSLYKPGNCTAVGNLVCNSNCTEVQLCMGDGSSGFIVETVESCKAGTSCYLPEKACSAYGSSCSENNFRFRCTSVGFFPDPYDCTRWYICVHDGDVDGEEVAGNYFLVDDEDSVYGQYGFEVFHEACEEGVAYDAGKQVCNLPMTSRPCVEGPVPSCVTLGQDGGIVENPSIYYVCHRENDLLFPVLHICPRGGIYNVVSKQCDSI